MCAELAGEPIYHLDSKRGQISSFFGAAAASNSKPNALSTKPVADSGSSNATTAAACLVGDVDGPPLLELPAQPVSSSTTSPLFSSSAVDSSQSSRNEDVSSSGSSVKRSSAHVIDLSIGESDDNDSGKGRKSFQLDSVASEKKPKLASILSPAPSASSRANAKANPPPSAGKITGFFRPK